MDFREALSCFHYSESDHKGSECFEQFKAMQECMAKFPTLYPSSRPDEEDEFDEEEIRKEAEEMLKEKEEKESASDAEASPKS